jgi:O-antigen/teichoic acid export membrane protein
MVIYDGGLNTIGIRHVAESNGKDLNVAFKIISFRIIAATVCSTLWIFLILFINPDHKFIWIFSSILVFNNALDLGFLYRSLNRYNLYLTIYSLNPILLFIFYFFFLESFNKVGIDLILLIIANLFCLVLSWIILIKKLKINPVVFYSIKEYFLLFKESSSMWLNSSIGIFYPSIQVYLIAILLGVEQNGIYKASLLFIAPFDLIMSTLNGILLPHITRWKSLGINLFKRHVYKTSIILLLIFLPFLLIVLFIPESFYHYILGKKFNFSILVFKLIFIGKIYLIVFTGFTYAVVANRFDNYFLKSTFFTSTLNLCLNLVLIKSFGLVGAAISTLISDVILPTLLFFKFQYIKDINFNHSYRQ